MYGHRGAVNLTPRYLELLELLKNEYEGLYQEVSSNRMQRDDVEFKLHSQIMDISAMQKALYDLERTHLKMKQHYEEEISRLKHGQNNGSPSTPTSSTVGSAATLIQFPTPPYLEAELQNFASGFANISYMSPSGADSSNHGGKRAYDEDPSFSQFNRNVRAREEQQQHSGMMMGGAAGALARRTSAPMGIRPMAPMPASSIQGGGMGMGMPTSGEFKPKSTLNQPNNQGSGSATATVVPTSPSSGFDWLVVYNPKAARSVTIDLVQTFIHESVVCCVKFSFDGRFLATGSNRVASIFDVKSGEKLASFSDLEGVQQDGDQFVRSVAFSPDGNFLVTGSEDNIVRIWDISKKELKHRFTGHTQDIYSIDFLPSGREVISGSGDRTIRIWNLEKDTCRVLVASNAADPNKDAGVTSIAVSPNGRYVACGSLDRLIRIWDLHQPISSQQQQQPIETLEGHRDSVYSVAFTPDGRHLISGSLDKTIKVWQMDTTSERVPRGVCKYTILGHKDFVLSVAGTPPDGRWIISGSKDRSVQFWDSHTGSTQLMLQGHKNSVISVAVSHAGTFFATGSGDFRARIWSYTKVSSPTTSNTSSGPIPIAAKSPSVESTGSRRSSHSTSGTSSTTGKPTN